MHATNAGPTSVSCKPSYSARHIREKSKSWLQRDQDSLKNSRNKNESWTIRIGSHDPLTKISVFDTIDGVL